MYYNIRFNIEDLQSISSQRGRLANESSKDLSSLITLNPESGTKKIFVLKAYITDRFINKIHSDNPTFEPFDEEGHFYEGFQESVSIDIIDRNFSNEFTQKLFEFRDLIDIQSGKRNRHPIE